MDHNEQSKELLQPILDLMSGTDGGAGFAKLRHEFLPEMLAKAEANDPLPAEFILMVTRFSRLCKLMMEKS